MNKIDLDDILDETSIARIAIVGAGLAGSMLAALLSKLGDNIQIYLFEKRSDPRKSSSGDGDLRGTAHGNASSALKRSINLALSHRGITSLKEVGLYDEVMTYAIPMPKRVIHSRDGTTTTQAYGQPGEALYSVGRQSLNCKLLDMLEGLSNVIIKFNHTVLDAFPNGTCQFLNDEGVRVEYSFDLIVGADGAYSSVRDSILRKGRVSFSRSYVSHGYKELSIPPKMVGETVTYAMDDYTGLHIWPRDDFMLIALPNPDQSFTATLFAPYRGSHGFDSMTRESSNAVIDYFRRQFPDIVAHMPDLVKDFHDNPVGSLLTVKVDPWNLGKIVLIGDAAHAVVPFFGQGMNAAFEDGYILYNMIKQYLQDAKESENTQYDFESLLRNFSTHRKPATDALADLCVEHYHDMASNTASHWYLVERQVQGLLSRLLAGYFVPLYRLVAFTNIPYDEAIARGKRQDLLLSRVSLGFFASACLGSAYLLHLAFGQGKRSLLSYVSFSSMRR